MTDKEAREYLLSIDEGKRRAVIAMMEAARGLTEKQLALVLQKAEEIKAEG